ncbi:MAG: hypothetical protein JXB88_23400, partial [Spirochaetales bacterium]|nr:hypothetical protein [Spirochaetales bacterium]
IIITWLWIPDPESCILIARVYKFSRILKPARDFQVYFSIDYCGFPKNKVKRILSTGVRCINLF